DAAGRAEHQLVVAPDYGLESALVPGRGAGYEPRLGFRGCGGRAKWLESTDYGKLLPPDSRPQHQFVNLSGNEAIRPFVRASASIIMWASALPYSAMPSAYLPSSSAVA